jgi:transcriptional repressor BetI
MPGQSASLQRSSRRPRGQTPRALVEDQRRQQLIEATISAISELGFRSATVGAIAERAGVSVGLMGFYFGDKEGLLEATLRHLVGQLGRVHVELLASAMSPRDRILALVEANLGPYQFDRNTAAVWLAFWAEVPVNPRFARIQRIYSRRMVSNLAHAYGGIAPRTVAVGLAEATAALIDGCWLRATLDEATSDEVARRRVTAFVDTQIALATLPLLKGQP